MLTDGKCSDYATACYVTERNNGEPCRSNDFISFLWREKNKQVKTQIYVASSLVGYVQKFPPRWLEKTGRYLAVIQRCEIFPEITIFMIFSSRPRFCSHVYYKDYGDPISQSFVWSLSRAPVRISLSDLLKSALFSYHFIGHFNHEFSSFHDPPRTLVFDFSAVVDIPRPDESFLWLHRRDTSIFVSGRKHYIQGRSIIQLIRSTLDR